MELVSHKTVRKSFRITEEEEALFRKQCERYGMTDSAYFRHLLAGICGVEGKEIRTKEEYLAIKELVNEINRIGTNINQIVKNANMHFYSESEKRKLFAMMETIKRKVLDL